MANVDIYVGALCPFCTRAKSLLRSKGVTFNEIDVTFNRAEKQAMIQRAKGGRTVPQIFVGEQHVGGCDELYALEAAGKLDALLEAESITSA
ncbi:MAG: glutaredoxin 3 [Pseudomonadota bacterium]